VTGCGCFKQNIVNWMLGESGMAFHLPRRVFAVSNCSDQPVYIRAPRVPRKQGQPLFQRRNMTFLRLCTEPFQKELLHQQSTRSRERDNPSSKGGSRDRAAQSGLHAPEFAN